MPPFLRATGRPPPPEFQNWNVTLQCIVASSPLAVGERPPPVFEKGNGTPRWTAPLLPPVSRRRSLHRQAVGCPSATLFVTIARCSSCPGSSQDPKLQSTPVLGGEIRRTRSVIGMSEQGTQVIWYQRGRSFREGHPHHAKRQTSTASLSVECWTPPPISAPPCSSSTPPASASAQASRRHRNGGRRRPRPRPASGGPHHAHPRPSPAAC